MKGFFRELRRRKVFRMTGFYVVGAWLIMQAADVFFPGWGLPDSAINVLLVAAVVGFPLASVFGWFYDITTHGIVRTPRADGDHSVGPAPLQRADYLMLTALVGMAIVILYRTGTEIAETPRMATAEGQILEAVQPSPVEKLPNSIAVLPFTNISSDPENEVFCDGISEEILNKLGAFGDLHVIARTSSFAFKGSNYGVPRISGLLGVRYLLQGSVRKAGDQLRISAQLVDETGAQRWSKTFDRELRNIFAIQSEIADVVASTVAPQVAHRSHSDYEPDVGVYQLFLAGREQVHRRNPDGAIRSLSQAVALDPKFAEAHAELAIALLLGFASDEQITQARRAIDSALELVPGLPRALAARGLLLQQQRHPDWAGSEAALREALEKDPNMVDAMNWLGNPLTIRGAEDESTALLERAAQLDPLHPAIAANLAAHYREEGDTERAEQMLLRVAELPNPGGTIFQYLRDIYLNTGQLVKMNAIEKRSALVGGRVYYGLALSYAVLGLWDQAAYWNTRMQRDFPDFFFAGYAELNLPSWQGRYRDSVQAFQTALQTRGADLSELAPIFSFYLGRDQARAGDYADAVTTLTAVLPENIDVRLLNDESIDWYHALAWSYLQLGDTDRAQILLQQLDDFFDGSTTGAIRQTNPYLYFYAQNTLLMGDIELAVDRLEKAVDAGWREYYTRHHDPRWAALKGNPRYEALMAKVKADVDRQRAEVERIDAEKDFPLLLDRVQAARQ